MADAALAHGGEVIYEPVRESLAQRVAARLSRGDVLLTLGAGDITRVSGEVRDLLEAA